jgi:hypothetical protein
MKTNLVLLTECVYVRKTQIVFILKTAVQHYLEGLVETRGGVVVKALCYSRKVAGSRPEEVNAFFSMYLILPAALGPGVHSASNRN